MLRLTLLLMLLLMIRLLLLGSLLLERLLLGLVRCVRLRPSSLAHRVVARHVIVRWASGRAVFDDARGGSGGRGVPREHFGRRWVQLRPGWSWVGEVGGRRVDYCGMY